jgi:hypothetical protein
MDRAARDPQVDLADRGEALEFLGELAGFENDVAHLARTFGCRRDRSVMAG